MVALVDGVPKTLSLKELIQHYVAHQREVVTRGRSSSCAAPRPAPTSSRAC